MLDPLNIFLPLPILDFRSLGKTKPPHHENSTMSVRDKKWLHSDFNQLSEVGG